MAVTNGSKFLCSFHDRRFLRKEIDRHEKSIFTCSLLIMFLSVISALRHFMPGEIGAAKGIGRQDKVGREEVKRLPLNLEAEKFFLEAVIFLAYIGSCGGLIRAKFSKRLCIAVCAGILFVVAAIQILLILSGQNPEFLLTVLPLTVYLPASIGLYLLSDDGIFQTTAALTIGFQVVFTLKILRKILFDVMSMNRSLRKSLLIDIILLLMAVVLVWIVYRFWRKPFFRYVERKQTSYLPLCFPIIMIFLLLSYFSNSTTNILVLILLFVTSVSVFLIIAQILVVTAEAAQAKQEQQQLLSQIQSQKQEYERVWQNNEQNRIYRHDSRHHLSVLEKLAKQNDTQELLEYISKLDNQLEAAGLKQCCENPIVNAVLSAGSEKAADKGCRIDMQTFLPKEIPFEETDLCVVFANALENAVNACAKIEEPEKRIIKVTAQLIDSHKLVILISNPFDGAIVLDDNGFPITQQHGEHGIGLKSIRAIADKYNGDFWCACSNNEFQFKAMLFGTQKDETAKEKKKYGVMQKFILAFFVFAAAMLLLTGFIPPVAQALEKVPALKVPIEVVKTVYFQIGWGDSSLEINKPVFGGTDKTVSEDFNKTTEEYIDEMKDQFMWYVSHKYEGYVNEQVSYQILRNDDRLFSVRFLTTVNAASSGEYDRCLTYDKKRKTLLALKDLFLEDSDYIGIISKEIVRQMTECNAAGEADYFVSGAGWPEEDCFREISADHDFYIDGQNRLVLVFDKYEVAPGSMGVPEFVIETKLIKNILQEEAPLD